MDNGEFGWANKGEGRFLDEKNNKIEVEEIRWGNRENTEVSQGTRDALGNATVGAVGVPVIEEVQRAENKQALVDNRTSEEIAIDAPEIAKDGDEQEDEWARKAEEVVEATRNNPRERMVRVAQLRSSYQLARFNRGLGMRND
ncbi:MAG: hypothetical protein Q4F60_01205 [Candidatus Saccharibacteria bacterium]|nr:hypothetical protein [Candidatus Saccharibacteria bacterium]